MKVVIQVSEKEKIPMGNIVGTHIAVLKDVETIEAVFLEGAIVATTNEKIIKPLLDEKQPQWFPRLSELQCVSQQYFPWESFLSLIPVLLLSCKLEYN